MDKIKFAVLVAYVQKQMDVGGVLHSDDIEMLHDRCVDLLPEPSKPIGVTSGMLDDFMRVMSVGTNKLEAIKLYRQFTGMPLKESKDAVERYWVSKIDPNQPRLSDILGVNRG